MITATLHRQLNVYLIDPYAKTIEPITIDKSQGLNDYYKYLSCRSFDIVQLNESNDVYVDDEGLLSIPPMAMFFSWEGSYQPYAGKGIVMGFNDDDGETISASISIEELREKIKFHTLAEVRHMF
jgi:hypothetical protein